MSSQNLEASRALRAFIPSKPELVLLPAFSLFFLALSSGYVFFSKSNSTQYELVSAYVEDQMHAGLSKLDQILGATLPTVLFWVVIGLIVYVLIWLGFGAYHAYTDDIPREKGMILPKDYNHRAVMRSSIAHLCIRLLAAVLLVFWMYLLFSQVLPYTSDTFLQEFADPSLTTPLYCLGATLLLAVWLFVIAILSRCIVLRDRVFTS